MKILLAHTHYQQFGGEDVVFQTEKNLLESYGQNLIVYERNNDESCAITEMIWSQKSYYQIKKLIAVHKPDVAHFHNTFFAMSPSVYYACYDAGLPVLQTLHNFRLICPGAFLLRNGNICEECIGHKVAWQGALHACWRQSHIGSAMVAAMLGIHHGMGTWQRYINRYIALSEFSRQKFIRGGLPVEKITVKPNSLPSPRPIRSGVGEFALFVGRLSHEKGVDTLIDAWRNLPYIPLRIIGDGPLLHYVQSQISLHKLKHIEVIGSTTRDFVFSSMCNARFLIITSKTYETFGMTLIEAFAHGVPVIVANQGSPAEMIANGETGLHFDSQNPVDLAKKSTWLWNNHEASFKMGKNARHEYEEKYTSEVNYRQLINIYEQALAEKP